MLTSTQNNGGKERCKEEASHKEQKDAKKKRHAKKGANNNNHKEMLVPAVLARTRILKKTTPGQNGSKPKATVGRKQLFAAKQKRRADLHASTEI